jgi:coenzyme F420-reducing hydrogenase gamma subunit
MKKPSKTAAELEASIKVEMEDICDWPTDMATSVQPDGDSWKVAVVQEGSVDDGDRREMVERLHEVQEAVVAHFNCAAR